MPVQAVLFDVFGTLADLEQLAPAFAAQGMAPDAVKLFFARTLRDAFALDAAERFVPFKEVAASALRVMGARDPEAILKALAGARLREDARAAFEHLRARGLRVGTLSNGAPGVTRGLLEAAGVAALVDEVISIEEVKRWKPRREVYEHGARRMGVPPAAVTLIAAHAWDVHGAARAGLRGVWVSSEEGSWAPAYGPTPPIAHSLLAAAQAA